MSEKFLLQGYCNITSIYSRKQENSEKNPDKLNND